MFPSTFFSCPHRPANHTPPQRERMAMLGFVSSKILSQLFRREMQTLKDDLSASQWPEADYEPDYERSPTLQQSVTPEPEEQQVLNHNHHLRNASKPRLTIMCPHSLRDPSFCLRILTNASRRRNRRSRWKLPTNGRRRSRRRGSCLQRRRKEDNERR